VVTPVPDLAPEQFGPYEVYERLGLGGMATVYRAKKRGPAGFELSVALKRMLSHLAEDPAFVESFVREAKVASLLQHPNIAQVYDFGRISGTYYIAMELVAGFDVRKLLRYANRANEAIPMPVILSILGELCDALDYAHTFVDEAGQPLHIVHRDVSPSNLIIAHTGHLKVIDFGIAKASSRSLHTESGQVKGKLGYMSPEVALGMAVGPVSDIFSLGVVAWELATASPLFSARTDFETMRKIREEPVAPPSRFNPACTPSLDQLILAALQRDPDSRLPSARLFRRALDEIAVETGSQISARGVAEWMLKYVQPADSWARAATAAAAAAAAGDAMSSSGARNRAPSSSGVSSSGARNRAPSGQPVPRPSEPPTAVLRMQRAPTPLRRSAEHVKLASEIWGADAFTYEEGGAANPPPDFHHQVATPAPTRAPSAVQLAPAPAPAAAARSSKAPVIALSALAVVAVALGGVLLWKRSSSSPPKAALRFEIEPAGAQVTIDGKEVGHTSPLDTELAPGVYPIAVELEGYESYASTITVREGDRQTIRVALDRKDLAISQTPPAAAPPVANGTTNEPDTTDAAQPATTQIATTQDVSKDTTKSRPSTTRPSTKREPKRGTKVEKLQVAEAAAIESPKVEPPKVEPPKVEPTPVEPPKPVETKPARTPVVAATAVTRLAGDIPTLRAKSGDGSGDVLAKMCIDEQGRVSSVKIVKSNPEIAGQLQSALASWRYKPYLRDSKASPVCFPLSLRVVVKSN
jgi:serine/threonine-protein kinase